MQVKRYEVATVRDALAMIKKDLGPDAVVLSTKKINNGGTHRFEVVAARDDGQQKGPAAEMASPLAGPESSSGDAEVWQHLHEDLRELKGLVKEYARMSAHNCELAELKEMMEGFFDILGFREKSKEQGCIPEVYGRLLAVGVSRQRALRLVEMIRGQHPPEEQRDYQEIAVDCIAKTLSFPPGKEGGKKIRAFVGPTGVGKTTTLAKLAARYTFGKKLSVGMITTDTYRIAAAEQLQVYGRIMNIPVAVAQKKDAFMQALAGFSDKDVVLVDTPGRSPADEDFLKDMNNVLSGGIPVRKELLLSLTSSRESMLDAAAKFNIFGYDRIIFTKLDECLQPGLMYDVVAQLGKPVSCVTHGQNVPQDIQTMNPRRLAHLIMGGTVCSGWREHAAWEA
jgi:flagellar biosynthesis protein FlhF